MCVCLWVFWLCVYLYLLCFCIVSFMYIYSFYVFVQFCKLSIFIDMFMYSYCYVVLFCIFCFHRANWHSSATPTEVFLCFFLSCKVNATVQLARQGTARTLPTLIVLFCVLYCCYRVSTQLQLTNISISNHAEETEVRFMCLLCAAYVEVSATS